MPQLECLEKTDLVVTSISEPITPVQKQGVIWLITGLVFLIRYIYSCFMQLVPDEAYYWDWTRFLGLGYFDHPPVIAWLTRISTAIFGDTVAAIKLIPALCGFGSVVFILLLAKRFTNELPSLFFLLFMFNAAVLSGIGTLLLTPDIPLILFWSAALYFSYRALYEPFRGVWILTGISVGLGLLSKYTFALFPIAFFVIIITDKKHRKILATPPPWVASMVAFIVFLPNLLWNVSNGCPSILFQLAHGLNNKKSGLRFDFFGEYIGGQIGIVTPFVFALIIMATVLAFRLRKEKPQLKFLLVFFLVPLAAFAISSLRKRVEANWPAPAYMAGFILGAWLFSKALFEGKKRFVRISLFGAGFGLLCTLIIMIHVYLPFLPLPSKADTTLQMRGWKEFGEDLGRTLDRIDTMRYMPVTANRYQETALLAFYLPGKPRTYSLNLHSRTNHYAMLKTRDSLPGKPIIFIHKIDDGNVDKLKQNFSTITLLDTVLLKRGRNGDVPYGVFTGILKPGVMN